MTVDSESKLRDRLNERVGTHIKRLDQIIQTAKTDALREFGLTVPQYATLLAIDALEPTSAAQLARQIMSTPQTIATITTNLEHKGLLSRRSSGVHQKVVLIELTDAGRTLLTAADRVALRIERRIRRAIGEDRFEALVDIVNILEDSNPV